MFIIYLILGAVVLYLANRDQKLYKLLFIPLLALSLFGTTEIYSQLNGVAKGSLVVASIGLGIALLHFYYRDFKETKLNFLKIRRYEREALNKIREKDPGRSKYVTIKNMRTGEERAYLVRPPKNYDDESGEK